MIVTLLSDFGLKDSYVAQVKGNLLQYSYVDHLVDITHCINPYDLHSAAFILKDCYFNFPKKTIHLVLLEILHNIPAKAWILALDDQWIVTSNNDFFSYFIDEPQRVHLRVYELNIEAYSYNEWTKEVAKIIGQLYSNPQLIDDFKKINLPDSTIIMNEKKTDNLIECKVMHIDNYGNLIFSLSKEEFEALRKERNFKILLQDNKTVIDKIVCNYSEVESNNSLARFNSSGHLEIAVRNGNASTLFGYKSFQKEQLIYSKILIQFI
jgi:S-adenosylmethionine hydrolase